MNFWSKRIKNNKSIADALEVEESKIKALKNDKLEIKGKTLDKTLQAIEEERINKAIRENEIWKWVQETDFKAKRLEYGYKTQREVAKLVDCDVSIICNLENRKERFKRVSPKLIDIYNFYTNDFNKKINDEKKVKSISKEKTIHHLNIKVNKDNKHIWKWYKNTDLKKLRQDKGYKSIKDVYKQIGVCQSCISDLELKKFKRVNKTMINAYNFYNDLEVEKTDLDAIYEWYKSVEDFREYRRSFGYSLNKFMSELNLSYDQARTFERHEYKSTTPVVEKIYNFYHDESKRLKAIEWEPNENNTFVVKQDNEVSNEVSVDASENNKKDEIAILEARIKQLELKNEQLELQIRRYEKLIDRL